MKRMNFFYFVCLMSLSAHQVYTTSILDACMQGRQPQMCTAVELYKPAPPLRQVCLTYAQKLYSYAVDNPGRSAAVAAVGLLGLYYGDMAVQALWNSRSADRLATMFKTTLYDYKMLLESYEAFTTAIKNELNEYTDLLTQKINETNAKLPTASTNTEKSADKNTLSGSGAVKESETTSEVVTNNSNTEKKLNADLASYNRQLEIVQQLEKDILLPLDSYFKVICEAWGIKDLVEPVGRSTGAHWPRVYAMKKLLYSFLWHSFPESVSVGTIVGNLATAKKLVKEGPLVQCQQTIKALCAEYKHKAERFDDRIFRMSAALEGAGLIKGAVTPVWSITKNAASGVWNGLCRVWAWDIA